MEPPNLGYANAPLFPSTVFPTLNPLPPVKYEPPPEAKVGEAPDEILAVVALLGLLRLFSRQR